MIHTHCFNFGHIVNQAQFVFFAAILENFDGFGARSHDFDYIIILCNQFFHARFDSGNIFGRKWFFRSNIVIKALFNDGADNHFCIRIELLDCMTDKVGARVADDFNAFLVFRGNDLDG